MRKICLIKSKNYRKYKNPKTSYIFNKILFLFTISETCGSDDEQIFKEGESFEILEVISLINKMLEC